MRPNGVVFFQPIVGNRLHLANGMKPISIQDIFPESAIETFNESILRRFSRLNKGQLDLAALGPGRKGLRDEFGAVVQAELLRQAAPQG